MKVYQDENVFEATMHRIQFLFEEFENVLVAFSGGKDSGVLLNLCYDYAKSSGILHKLSMYHLDYEAQYTETTKYVERCFDAYTGIRKFWLCLPISAQCAVSMVQDHWVPWDEDQKEIWARPMPVHESVIHEKNVPFLFEKTTWDYDVQRNFGLWFSKTFGKTAVVVGIRTDESLKRLGAIASCKKVNQYNKMHWVTKDSKNASLCLAYPIYDWNVEDIWICNGKKGYDYNRLYDLYYQAGLSLDDMRVASPFNDCAINNLKIYKIVEPNMWAKLVGRVNGVNFASIYGGTTAMGWKNIKLPPGHTWKSYLNFLLDTLPEETRSRYLQKFNTSIEFWKKKGGVLSEETIAELREKNNVSFEVGSETNYHTEKKPVTFEAYPDDLDVTDFKSVPSYKRMCICIMKNDHLCKYMGFSQTKKELEQRKKVMKKYQNIIRGRSEDEISSRGNSSWFWS